MELKCTFPQAFVPRPAQAAPAWADPYLMMAVSAFRSTSVVIEPDRATLILPPDPKRIGWGMSNGYAGPASTYVAPHTDPRNTGWYITAFAPDGWFELLKYGAAICEAWYAWNMNGLTAVVFEIYRLK